MGKAILITGGARSGKSSFAESRAKELGEKILYIATAQAFDEEMKLRIKKHRESRPSYWDTVESYRDLGKIIADQGSRYQGILVDCITIMVTNLLLDCPEIQKEDFSRAGLEKAEATVMEEISALAEGIAAIDTTVLLVTNELGSGIVPEYPLARTFRDIAGRANQFLGAKAQEVYLTVCGVPIRIK